MKNPTEKNRQNVNDLEVQRSLKVIGIDDIQQDIYILLVFWINNVSFLRHFQDISTFTVYVSNVSVCVLDKSLNFDKTVKINILLPICDHSYNV